MPVEIVEVLRRAEQGITKPFICRGDDGEIYFVKGLDAGRRSQICEWVAGRLAVLVGLPVAPFEIVNVPDELMDMGFGPDLRGLGPGPAFGSRERRVTELTVSGVEEVPQDLQQDVLLFDWWVRNGDRCLGERGGNPNLFWNPGGHGLVVIDHNQAFELETTKDDFVKYHAFSKQTQELSGDFFRREEYTRRFSNALDAWEQILGEIPENWWYQDAEMTVPVDFDTKAVYELLTDFERDEFWSWR